MEIGMHELIALVALTVMEIVLGIDNIVFIAILTDRLPESQQPLARRLGLAAAMLTRIVLLCTLSAIMGLTAPIWRLSELGIPAGWMPVAVNEISWRDIIVLAGGLFLIGKSVHEIHEKIEGSLHESHISHRASFRGVILQIAILDIVFSLDSVITAVGMAEHLWVMILAIMLAVGVMLYFAERVSAFISRHPTLKMLALSFLILIGVMLVAEGIGTHIDKGYIYFAMAFSLLVEFLNIRVRQKTQREVSAA